MASFAFLCVRCDCASTVSPSKIATRFFDRYNIVSSSDLRDAATRLGGTFGATK
jgi:hypothetical protein